MKENDSKFSVSTITEKIKNSQRLVPFLILTMGTILPIAIIPIDSITISRLPQAFHQYLGTLLFVSVFWGWIFRYMFILYDAIAKNIRIRSLIVYSIILVIAILLALKIGTLQHSLNVHMADEEYSLETAFFNAIVAINAFPLVVFFSRKTNVKKESLCLAMTVGFCLLGSLLAVVCFG